LLSEIEQIKNKTGINFRNEIYEMLARFLLSCLVGADHTNGVDFERGMKVEKTCQLECNFRKIRERNK
jgi:hypothetical protein